MKRYEEIEGYGEIGDMRKYEEIRGDKMRLEEIGEDGWRWEELKIYGNELK